MGIFEKAGDVKANWGDKHILIKSSAPGTFFVLAAALVMGTALTRGVSFERHAGGETIGDRHDTPHATAEAMKAEPDNESEHEHADDHGHEHVSAVTQAPAAPRKDDPESDALEPATAPTTVHLNVVPPPQQPTPPARVTRAKPVSGRESIHILATKPPVVPPDAPVVGPGR